MFKDIPREFSKVGATSAIAQLLVYGYLANQLYEKTIGYRPAFDPIGVAKQAYEDYNNPKMAEGQATKNLLQNTIDQLPFASVFTGGRIPLSSALPSPAAIIKDPTMTTMVKEFKKPMTGIVMPLGGNQLKKTYQGINAIKEKGVYSQSGNLMYPVLPGKDSSLKTVLFGPNSTSGAKEYWREGKLPLSDVQTQVYKANPDPGEAYSGIEQVKGLQKQVNVLDDQIKAINDNTSLTTGQKKLQIAPLTKQKTSLNKEIDKIYNPLKKQAGIKTN